MVLNGIENHIPQDLYRRFQLFICNRLRLTVRLVQRLIFPPVGLLGQDALQLPFFLVLQADLSAHDRAHIAAVENQRHREVHQIRVAAVNIRLSRNGRVESPVGVALLAHLGKSLNLPPQLAMRGKAAVFGDGTAPVVHRHEGQPHGF